MERVTGLPRDEAYRLQKRYLADYGLTLGGLVAHHGVDPADYHAMFDDLPLDVLAEDPALVAAIGGLAPGRRLIFTNANDVHAGRVLERLALAHLFHDIFHIRAQRLCAQAQPGWPFERMDAALNIDPATAFSTASATSSAGRRARHDHRAGGRERAGLSRPIDYEDPGTTRRPAGRPLERSRLMPADHHAWASTIIEAAFREGRDAANFATKGCP